MSNLATSAPIFRIGSTPPRSCSPEVLQRYKDFFGCSLDFHGELYGGPGKVAARVFYPINQKETCIDYREAFDDETPESAVFIFVTGFPKGVQDLTKSVYSKQHYKQAAEMFWRTEAGVTK